MWVRSVILGRYGAYEDRRVDFGSGLTVVHGPNEAGKSTLLDALSDVLWGYQRPVRHAYLVAPSRLDITATVAVDDVVTTIRRSPKKVTGDAPDWGVAEQDAWRAWRQGFGLSHAELRRGGQALCEGDGDLAELVFSVRSGADVRTVLSALSDEADRLYKTHKGAKSVGVRAALGRADAAETALRQQMATAADVAALEERVRRAEEARSAIAAEVARAAESARLARQRAACHPHVADLVRWRVETASLAAEGCTPDQAQLAALTAAYEASERAAHDIASAEEELQQRRGERGALDIDDALLADTSPIRALAQAAQARERDRDRLDHVSAQAQAHRHTAVAALDDLTGIDERAIDDRLRELHVPADRIAALDELGCELAGLEATHERLRAAHLEATRRVRELSGSVKHVDLDAARKVTELSRAISAEDAAPAKHRAAIEERNTALKDIERALALANDLLGRGEQTIAGARPSENPSRTSAHAVDTDEGDNEQEEVRSTPVAVDDVAIPEPPEAARMAGLRDRLRAATTSVESAIRDHSRAVDAREHAWRDAAEAGPDAGLPSADDLRQARAERDLCLQTLLAGLRSGDGTTVTSAAVGLVHASQRADRLADDLIAGADHLAVRERRHADLLAADHTVGEAIRALDAARREHRFASSQWTALWIAGGSTAPSPDDADTVRRALEDAHSARLDVHDADDRIRPLQDEVDELCRGLGAALGAVGHTHHDGELPSLLAAADEINTVAARSREDRARLDELRSQARLAGTAEDAARHDRDQALSRWRFELAVAGAPTDLQPAQWTIRRDTVAAAHRAHLSARELEREAAELRTTVAAFDDAVAEQTSRHATTAVEDREAALAELVLRLTTAEATRISAAHHDREIATTLASLQTAKDAATEADAIRARIAAELGVAETEIDAVVERGRRKIDLDADIAHALQLVRTAAPDLDTDRVLAEIDHHSPDELHQIRDAAVDDEAAHRARLDEATESLGGLRRDLDELHATQPAAVSRARVEEHIAHAAESAERYIVLQVQREILARELAAYERRHSSHLLTTAGELLDRLTGGRYLAVRPTTRDGRPSLVAVRADDEEQHTDELSEGSADQLYLALRLAGIDQLQTERADRGAPMVPVVLDDILTTFDDVRASAALTVLNELAARWQIILLTHHHHIVELARRLDATPTFAELDSPAVIEAPRDARALRSEAALVPLGRIPVPRDHTADPGHVRAWARANGHDVGERGRIPTDILSAYRKAEHVRPEIA